LDATIYQHLIICHKKCFFVLLFEFIQGFP